MRQRQDGSRRRAGKKGQVLESDVADPRHCRQTEGPGQMTLLLLLNSHNLKAFQPPGKLQCGTIETERSRGYFTRQGVNVPRKK